MNKKKYLVLILFLGFMIPNVSAKTTTNGISINNTSATYTELYCEYSGGAYVLIRETDHIEVEPDSFDYPGYLPFKKTDYDTMRSYKFLDSSNNWDCPLYAKTVSGTTKITDFSNSTSNSSSYAKLDVSKSFCEGKCSIYTPGSNKYTCEYSSGSKKITINGEGNSCTITYPDGSSEVMINGVCGNTSVNGCPDLYYNKRTNDFEAATYDYNEWFKKGTNNYDPSMYSFLCGNDKDNIEYYCSGSCKFPANKNIDCQNAATEIHGVTVQTDLPKLCSQEGILKSFRFFGYLLFVVKIIVPILLIIMGTLDFGKAVIASNQDAVSKAAKMFAIRIVVGVSIFLLPTIVNFVFGLLPSSVSDYNACKTCLFDPTNCDITD